MQLECGSKIDVPKILSESMVKSFVEMGYLAVPDLVAPEEIGELRRDAAKLARGGYPNEGFRIVADRARR